MVELLYDVLENTSIAISIVPLTVLLLIWKRAKTSTVRLFFVLLLIESIAELFSLILVRNHINNWFILHIYTLAYTCLLYLIYRQFLSAYKSVDNILWFSIIVIISEMFEATINDGYLRVNTFTYLLLSGQAIFYALKLFFLLINDNGIKDVIRNSTFWINSGVLFYFGTTLCLTLFESYIFEVNPQLIYYTWSIQLVANIIFHLVLARGIWLMRRT